MATLDEIISGQESNTEPEVETKEQPRGEDGRWIPADQAEEQAAPPAATPEPEPVKAPPKEEEHIEDRVPQAALLDERRKRQALERKLQELEAKVPEPETAVPSDFWEAPEKALSAAEKRAVEKARAEMQEQLLHERANFSEMVARVRYPDYDVKRAVFAERIANDPVLNAELHRNLAEGKDFGEFVYQTSNRLQELTAVKEVGSVEALVAKRVQEELAKLNRGPSNVPASLNATPSPATSTETWSGPPPLDAILKRR